MTKPRIADDLRSRRSIPLAAILLVAVTLVATSLSPSSGSDAPVQERSMPKPTVVLVHGAWADASGWNRVTRRLQEDGYKVVALANPLRSLSGDAAYVRTFLDTVQGPIILVGHSYGGAVITNAATGNPNVKALVYINAFAPDEGEFVTGLAGPDSALSVDPTTIFDFVPATLPPTGATDLYLKRSTVFASFATGLKARAKALVAAAQRPATLGALNEPSGTPAWRTIRSWALVGLTDAIIPPKEQRAMAAKAGAAITEYDGGHLGLMSDPEAVTRIIERAAKVAVR
jgi:pimeloyl-ACP methyl ester carboxylesterase